MSRYARLGDTSPKFLEHYQGKRPGRKYLNSNLNTPELYLFAKRVSWCLAYKKIFDVVDEHITTEFLVANPGFKEQYKLVKKSLKDSVEDLSRGGVHLSSGEEFPSIMDSADRNLAALEEAFPSFVTSAKKEYGLITEYNGRKFQSSEVKNLLHTIARDEVMDSLLGRGSYAPMIDILNSAKESLQDDRGARSPVSTLSAASPREDVSVGRSDSAVSVEAGGDVLGSASSAEPDFMSRYSSRRTGISAMMRGEDRGSQYGLRGSPHIYRLAKKISWALAFEELVKEMEVNEDPEVQAKVRIAKENLKEFFKGCREIFADHGWSESEKTREAKQFNRFLNSAISSLNQAREITIRKGDDILISVADKSFSLRRNRLEDIAHKIESTEKFPKFITKYGSLKVFDQSLLEREVRGAVTRISALAPILTRSRSESRSSYDSLDSEDLGVVSPTASIDPEPDHAILDISVLLSRDELSQADREEYVQKVEGSIELASVEVFERKSMSYSEIDDMIDHDLQKLAWSKERNEDNVKKLKTHNKKYQTDLKDLYSTISEYYGSKEVSDAFISGDEGLIGNCNKQVKKLVENWSVERLNRKLSFEEEGIVKTGILAVGRKYSEKMSELRNQTSSKLAGQYAAAAGMFLCNVVWAVSVVGPLAYTVNNLSKGKGPSWKSIVPDTIMSFYDPATRERKALMSAIDRQMIDAIRRKKLGGPVNVGGGEMGHSVEKRTGRKKDSLQRS